MRVEAGASQEAVAVGQARNYGGLDEGVGDQGGKK